MPCLRNLQIFGFYVQERCSRWVLVSMRLPGLPFHFNESSTVRVNLWRYSSVAFKSVEINMSAGC